MPKKKAPIQEAPPASPAKKQTGVSKSKPAINGTPSKSEAVIALLSRKGGATIDELQKATGWQPHSVRGFLSGTVKKRSDLKLSSEKPAKGSRRYHVKAA